MRGLVVPLVATVLFSVGEYAVSSFVAPGNQRAEVDAAVDLVRFKVGCPVVDSEAAALVGTASVEAECGYWDVESEGCYLTFGDCADDFGTFNETVWLYHEYSDSKADGTRECDQTSSSGSYNCSTVTDQLLGCDVSGS